MQFRHTHAGDLPEILYILEQARQYLRAQGVDQWQGAYPDAQTVRNDIERGLGYAAAASGQVLGVLSVSFEPEPSYARLFDGVWRSGGPYAVLHRLAVHPAGRGQGVGDFLLLQAEQLGRTQRMNSLRVDTHRDNRPMRRLLERSGFVLCGRVLLEPDNPTSERVAYEKLLEPPFR